MKTFTSMVMAFFLVLAVVPAMAADRAGRDREPVTAPALDQAPLTFQAFSKLPATEREALTPLTDKELAAIEGSFLEAQRNPLGCNESCITQIVTRLAPSLKGANIAVVHQTPGSQGSLTMYNISTVQQSSGGR